MKREMEVELEKWGIKENEIRKGKIEKDMI